MSLLGGLSMSLYVSIGEAAMKRLRELAKQERRRPQDQAAVLLESALGIRQYTKEVDKADAYDEPKT
jgi:hypothetical protein